MSPTALAALTAIVSATSPLDLGERRAERWDVFRERMEAGTIFFPRTKPHPLPKDDKPCH